MKFENWRLNSFMLVFIGAGVYIIFTLVAMLFYAGGTYENPDIKGYSFFHNFFSDLGRTEVYSGDANTLSWILFTVSIFTIGIAMILFYAAWINLFQGDDTGYMLAKVGTSFGIIGALGFIGVGLTPADLLLDPHILFVRIGFISIFISSIIYSYVL